MSSLLSSASSMLERSRNNNNHHNSSQKNASRKRPPPETDAETHGGEGKSMAVESLSKAARAASPIAATTSLHSSSSAAALGGGGGGGTKPYKGLRHFSMMVCKKVEEKGVTTYNEVADELVQHVISERHREDPSSKFDEKNIRRRVYDALNVLMAMDIITKEKKAISWKGLPTSAHADLDMLQREKEYRQQEVQRKREALQELLVQQVCFRNLVTHNLCRTDPLENKDHKIPLPFIVVNTHSSAVIQCNMSRDLTDVMFDFSQPFEINDDNTILKRLGMHKTNHTVLREMLPEELMAYAEKHGMLDSVLLEEQQKDDPASSSSDTKKNSETAIPAPAESAPPPSLGATNDYYE